MHAHSDPFTIPDIRAFVPEKIKPWILLAFVIVFQLSGGVYLAAISEMTGALALLPQDILMAGYASLVGLALTFTIMFRLKFRFSIKNSLMITALGLIACNLICIHTHRVPVLVATCFVSGILRMWATFSCNTTIQLWITPNRNMPVWFCFINLLVQSAILMSGVSSIYVGFISQWEYMHWFIIGMLLGVALVTFVIFRHYHSMKKIPLSGIDFLGMLLWGATLLSAIFVLIYGDHFDWYESLYIQMGMVFGLVTLALNLWRASFIEQPFIALKTWRYRNAWLTFALLLVVDILLSPAHLFEHLYAEAILGYDAWHIISLNGAVLLGIVAGVFFAYRTFALRKWRYKTMTIIGVLLILAYLMSMYFMVSFHVSKEMLILPLFLRGCGYVILAITFLTALSVIPFEHFPQALTIQGFASACLGSLVGTTLLEHVFKQVLKQNVLQLTAHFDNLNTMAKLMPPGELSGYLHLQASLISMKAIYGWLCMCGIFFLLVLLVKKSALRPQALFPKFRTIRRLFKHRIRLNMAASTNDLCE